MTLIVAVSLLGIFYAFIFSKDLRQMIFPLEIKRGSIAIACQDVEIISFDELHLKEIDVKGPIFHLSVPDVKVDYGLYPPVIRGVTASGPDITLTYRKTSRHIEFYNSAVEKIISLITVRNGHLYFSWKNISIDFASVELWPANGDMEDGRGIVARGRGIFHATLGKQIIDGNATLALEEGTGRIEMASRDIVARLSGHPEIHLDADISTGLKLKDLGVFTGELKIEDALPLLPPSIRHAPYMTKRLVGQRKLPASASMHLDLKHGSSLSGSADLPVWLFPRHFSPSASLPATWKLAITHDFLGGNYTAIIPGAFSTVHGGFRVRPDSSVWWSATVESEPRGLGVIIDDNRAAEHMSATIVARLEGVAGTSSATRQKLGWEISATAKAGDVMVYPWFFSLDAIKPRLTASGDFLDGKVFVRKAKVETFLDLELQNMEFSKDTFTRKDGEPLRRILKSRIGPDSDIKVHGALWDTWNILIKEPFSVRYPVLESIQPHGTFSTRLNRLGVELGANADIAWKKQEVLHGIEMHALVPLEGDVCNTGSLSWDWIFFPIAPSMFASSGAANATTAALAQKQYDLNGFRLEKGSIYIDVCADRLLFGSVRIPAGDGMISIGSGVFQYDTRTLRLQDINIKDIKLERLVNGFKLPAVLNAKGVSIEVRGGRLQEHGTIETRIAGGVVKKDNLWLEFSGPVPRYGGDIKFENIDLETVSSLATFGKVTGRIDGSVTGLVMSGYQPEAFELEVRSRKVPGVRQEISVKAIRNLSILGGGTGGISLLGEFFKSFSYKRIAVSCKLKNDIFTLHGLIKRDGQEYLVERGLWGGINVINQNPGGRIAFSDMMERLHRIKDASGPKIK